MTPSLHRLAFALLPAVLGCQRAVPLAADPSPAIPADSVAEPLSAPPPPASAGATERPAPASAPSLPTLPPLSAANLAARRERGAKAEACWKDLGCDLATARRLTREAVTAGAPTASCEQAYYGVGMAVDLPLARACFERAVAAETDPRGSSPGPDRLLLAAMLIDSQAGPRDAERAIALFKTSFEDASVQGLKARAAKGGPGDKPLDFCADIGGTTLAMSECAVILARRDEFAAAAAEKALAEKLDAEARTLLGRAVAAWEDLARKEALLASDRYRGGTIRQLSYPGAVASVHLLRAKALARALDPTGKGDAGAGRELGEALATVRAGSDAERQKLLQASEASWKAVREAQLALAQKAPGANGPSAAKAGEWLDRRHLEMVKADTDPGP